MFRPGLGEAGMIHCKITNSVTEAGLAGQLPSIDAAPTGAISFLKTALEGISTTATREPLCRPAQQGAGGAGKILVTDYRFAGPGFATRKLVGRGTPPNPPTPVGVSA